MEKLIRERLKKIMDRRAIQKEEICEFNRLRGKHLSIIVCTGKRTCDPNSAQYFHYEKDNINDTQKGKITLKKTSYEY